MNKKLPSFRIIYLHASEIYHAKYIVPRDLLIKNTKETFDRHYSDVLTFNLDLLFLLEYEKKFNIEDNSLTSKKIKDEYYTDAFVNVSFEYSLWMNEDKEMVFKKEELFGEPIHADIMREDIYKNGFILNGKKYVRYKRSAGAAKSATCLFIKESLYRLMNSWSKAGLNEGKDHCLDNLTSYEAYKALSLSSIVKIFDLNPYNILFVKDFKHFIRNEKVVKVDYVKGEGLVATREECDIENNIFDGEGLLDVSIFEKCGYLENHNKGMMLLRNRFFKCCAFNTNLQKWFEHNKITSVDQLYGITFADDVKDIVLVASESCLKYLKMTEGGFNKENIRRWCDAVSDKNQTSTFGVVKTDKETRFFDGEMVETTYQLLNTLCLRRDKELRPLLKPYYDYIGSVRNIKETPEYVKLFLQGVVWPYQSQNAEEDFEEDYEDDSEDEVIADEELDYSEYNFKNKICYEMLDQCKDFVRTEVFKNHLFDNIIDSFRYKLYNGRILIDGTYATLLGNPLEYLKYIIKKGESNLLEYGGVTSSMGRDEIYCSFFKNEEELVGSRAPHMTMGNVLYAKNVKPDDLDVWFNLTRNIVVVDAINNNIQHRLNGADYDSDSMLLTNNKTIVEVAEKYYDRFPVPYSAFSPKKLTDEEAKKVKETPLVERIIALDHKIANNRTGMIVDLSQKLNSHLWNNIDKNGRSKKDFNEEELYNNICILAVLAGAEIDSAKKSFDFTTYGVYCKVSKFANEHGFKEKPVFFFSVNPDGKDKPHTSAINTHVKELINEKKPFFNTTMDHLWALTFKMETEAETRRNVKTFEFFKLVRRDIKMDGLSKTNYAQVEASLNGLKAIKKILYSKRRSKKKSKSYEVKKKQFNDKIEACYKIIETGINNLKKVKKLIKSIEKIDTETRDTLFFVLLYIISVKEKELGYSYQDLFINDGGIPSLIKTRNKNSEFVLFDRFHYKVAPPEVKVAKA